MTDERRPLAGRRVLVTRTREQAERLVDRLHDAGASVVVVPLITTVPVAAPDAIAAVAADVAAAPAPRWVAFTSATAVRLVVGAAGIEALSPMLVAVVGPATAAALEAEGRTPDLVAPDHDAAGLSAAMLGRGVAGATVWFPVAEGSRGDLAGSAPYGRRRSHRATHLPERHAGSAHPSVSVRHSTAASTRSRSRAAAPRDTSWRQPAWTACRPGCPSSASVSRLRPRLGVRAWQWLRSRARRPWTLSSMLSASV